MTQNNELNLPVPQPQIHRTEAELLYPPEIKIGNTPIEDFEGFDIIEDISIDMEFPSGMERVKPKKENAYPREWLLKKARRYFDAKVMCRIMVEEFSREFLGRPLRSKRYRLKKKYLPKVYTIHLPSGF